MRWLIRAVCIHTVVYDYLFYVDYVNTKENTVADALSRMVDPSTIVNFEGNPLDPAKERKVGRWWGKICQVWYGRLKDQDKLARLLKLN